MGRNFRPIPSTGPLTRRAVVAGVGLCTLAGMPWPWRAAGAQEARRVALAVVDRQLPTDQQTLKVSEGDQVTLVWTSDQALSLHLHGYDIELEVPAETPTEMSFEAFATGRYPVTLHDHGSHGGHEEVPLLYLEVHPR